LNNKIKTSKVAYDALLNETGMSRRDALKVMGLTGGAAMMMGAPTKVEASSTDKKVKIVIVGGGAGGMMATVLYV